MTNKRHTVKAAHLSDFWHDCVICTPSGEGNPVGDEKALTAVMDLDAHGNVSAYFEVLKADGRRALKTRSLADAVASYNDLP